MVFCVLRLHIWRNHRTGIPFHLRTTAKTTTKERGRRREILKRPKWHMAAAGLRSHAAQTAYHNIFRYVVRHRSHSHSTRFHLILIAKKKKERNSAIAETMHERAHDKRHAHSMIRERKKKIQNAMREMSIEREMKTCGIECVMWRHCCRCNQKYSFFTSSSSSFSSISRVQWKRQKKLKL